VTFAQVRSISCWTLGRYSKWLVQGVQEGQTRVPGLTPQDAQVCARTTARLPCAH